MKNQNQIQVGDISSIRHSGNGQNVQKPNEAQQVLLLGGDEYQKSKQQKLKYLKFLEQKNKIMYDQIKQLGKQLDTELQKLKKKGHLDINKLIYKKRNPRVKISRNPQVQKKYQQMNKLKSQIQTKLQKKQALSLLQHKYKNLKAQYRNKYEELQTKEKTYHQLLKKQKQVKKIEEQKQLLKYQKQVKKTEDQRKKSQPSSFNKHKSNKSIKFNQLQKQQKQHKIIELNLQNYQSETKKLRQKIKQESDRVYKERDLFIKNNKTNKKKNQHYKNNSISNIKPKQQEQQQYLTAKGKELKKQYETIGKRIELLRIQKLTLMKSGQEVQEKRKYYNHVKSKLHQLEKILK